MEPSTDGRDKLVFTEDLKNVTFLMSDSEEEINLLKEMIRKFNAQNKDLRFGSFIFGPVVMRLLHTFKKSDVALELLRDPTCEGFFDQLSSITVLADLLFENKQYNEVWELHDDVVKRAVFDAKFPRDLLTTVMAASYQLNSPEIYSRAKELVSDIRKQGGFLATRAISFFSALALKHNEPDTSFEALSVIRRPPPLTRNLKILTQCRLNRSEDALLGLRSYLCDDGVRKGADITKEAIEELTKSVSATKNTDWITEAEQIVRSLSEKNHVTPKSLEELLLEPIHIIKLQDRMNAPGSFRSEQERLRMPPNPYNQRNQNFFENNRRSQQSRQGVTPIYQRRGLREME